jgi:hypothetical protein
MIAASRRNAAFASAVFFLAASGPAPGDALLAACQPRTARGEPAALYLREFSLKSWEALPGALELPGQVLSQPIQGLLAGRVGIAITRRIALTGSRRAGGPQRELVAFTTSPLRGVSAPLDLAWEPVQALAGPAGSEGDQRLVVLERAVDAAAPGGRVAAYRVRINQEVVRFERAGVWDVQGPPVAAAADWERGRVFIVSDGTRGPAVQVVEIDLNSAAQRSVTLAVSREDTVNARPVGLALAGGGARLCLLMSGYSLTQREGGRISTTRWMDAESLEAQTGGPDVAGLGEAGVAALVQGAGGTLWARTYEEAGGFAYATLLADRGESPAKLREEAFREASAAPGVAASPDGSMYVLAAGKNVRILRETGGDSVARSFPQRVEAVAWGESGLYVGEGPRLHEIDPGTGATRWSRQVAEGFIVDLFAVAGDPKGAAEVNPAADSIPARVELDADTPGRDARVVSIPLPPGTRVRPVYDERRAPWLRPRMDDSVGGQARLTLALDKVAVPGSGAWTADVDVKIGEAAGDHAVESSLGQIEVSASSLGERVRTIEWQTSGVQRGTYDALMEFLSGPPLHFSHRVRRGPFSLAPRGSAAVVVRLEDVASGAITRQVLLDYVSGGGGLLVLAGHAPEVDSEGLRRWLEPLGLLLDSAHEVTGRFAVGANRVTNLGLDQLSVAAGAYVEVTRPVDLSVEGPAPGTAVLALRRHGYGRLGVMSGDAALGAQALNDPANRRFARALFGWLVGTNAVVRDSDLDGLRDDVEDVNANDVADHGETDFLRPDTDGDGVPDGAEDANLNGVVDEGETDPRRADTDGDGVPDGADAEPLPRGGSPVILGVRPATGPAEGGTLVEVEGRNLPVNPQVWFGEQRATHVVRVDSTRLVAAAPPRPFGAEAGPMPVRVAHPLGMFENTVEAAFSYGDATPVRLTLEALERVRRAYDGYRGSLAMTLDLADVRIDTGVFYVRTEPVLQAIEATLTRGAGLISAGRDATVTRYGARQFRIVLGPGEPLTGRVELGTLAWHLTDPAPEVARIRWYVAYPALEVQWGGVAEVVPSESWTDLDGAVTERVFVPAAAPASP